LSCFTDSRGRPTLARFIPVPGVYAAGRLDFDSEGLLLLTSDGELAHHMTDPKHKLPKVYWVQVERKPDTASLDGLRKGVMIAGRRTRPAKVEVLDPAPVVPERSVPIRFRKTVPTTWLAISIQEGVNRQVRRMTAAVGHPTLRLIRVAMGPILLGDLRPGEWRELSNEEIEMLKGA
jgi:23S rRNA pseudouridine2457 synthase